MLIALAVATIAAAPAPRPTVLAQATPVASALSARRASRAPRCEAAGRFQTSAEPALLFREQDRAGAQAKKLIDLPDGEKCLLGGSEERPPAER